jgi:hypothetical protein
MKRIYYSIRRPSNLPDGMNWIDSRVSVLAARNVRELSVPGNTYGLEIIRQLSTDRRLPPVIRVRRGDYKTEIEQLLESNHRPCASCISSSLSCGLCEQHHICVTCGNGCGCTETPCVDCSRCPSHCECTSCNRCLRRNIPTYQCCGMCDLCCRCTSRHGAGFIEENHRSVGVEWEYNSAQVGTMKKWARAWRGGLHPDGSCGMEAVTPPISGKYIRECLTALGEALHTGGAEINNRCGLHVHVSVADYSWQDMYRLVRLYIKVEPLLFLLGGQLRINNQYCVPNGEKYKLLLTELEKGLHGDPKGALIASALDCRTMSRAREAAKEGIVKKSQGRYKGLNILPWLAGKNTGAPDTTVEFRLHRNTDSPERVIGWATLLANLVSWACKASDAELNKLPRSALRTLIQISPDSKDYILKRIQDWRKATALPKRVPRRVSIEGGCYRLRMSCDALRKKQSDTKPEMDLPCKCVECTGVAPNLLRFDTFAEELSKEI